MSAAEDLAMIRTRRTLEALLMTKTARRRASYHRDPSVIEIVLGLAAFVAVAAFGLYLAAALAG
jgi:hypothetical protein